MDAVAVGAAELLEGDLLARDGLHDIGPGDEHLRDALDHEREVHDGGRVDRAAGGRAEDGRYLRHDAGGEGVAHEDLAVPAQGGDALLDASAAGVGHADDRPAVAHGHIHDLADLLGSDLGQRAPEDGEVLGVDIDSAAVDLAVAGDYRIARVLAVRGVEVD